MGVLLLAACSEDVAPIVAAVRGRVFWNQRAALVFASCRGTIARHSRTGKISLADCWLARGRVPGEWEGKQSVPGVEVLCYERQPYTECRAVFLLQ